MFEVVSEIAYKNNQIANQMCSLHSKQKLSLTAMLSSSYFKYSSFI